jgi:hypothetical protein
VRVRRVPARRAREACQPARWRCLAVVFSVNWGPLNAGTCRIDKAPGIGVERSRRRSAELKPS